MGLGSCWECARRPEERIMAVRRNAARMRRMRRTESRRRVRNAGLEAAGWSGEKMADLGEPGLLAWESC